MGFEELLIGALSTTSATLIGDSGATLRLIYLKGEDIDILSGMLSWVYDKYFIILYLFYYWLYYLFSAIYNIAARVIIANWSNFPVEISIFLALNNFFLFVCPFLTWKERKICLVIYKPTCADNCGEVN